MGYACSRILGFTLEIQVQEVDGMTVAETEYIHIEKGGGKELDVMLKQTHRTQDNGPSTC